MEEKGEAGMYREKHGIVGISRESAGDLRAIPSYSMLCSRRHLKIILRINE